MLTLITAFRVLASELPHTMRQYQIAVGFVDAFAEYSGENATSFTPSIRAVCAYRLITSSFGPVSVPARASSAIGCSSATSSLATPVVSIHGKTEQFRKLPAAVALFSVVTLIDDACTLYRS